VSQRERINVNDEEEESGGGGKRVNSTESRPERGPREDDDALEMRRVFKKL
jgi:hypothetical protein